MKINWYNTAQSNPAQMAKVRPPIAKRDEKKLREPSWHISDEKKSEEFELESKTKL